jgi:hypothetical protein
MGAKTRFATMCGSKDKNKTINNCMCSSSGCLIPKEGLIPLSLLRFVFGKIRSEGRNSEILRSLLRR